MACIQNDSAWFDIIFRIQYNIKKTGGLIMKKINQFVAFVMVLALVLIPTEYNGLIN